MWVFGLVICVVGTSSSSGLATVSTVAASNGPADLVDVVRPHLHESLGAGDYLRVVKPNTILALSSVKLGKTIIVLRVERDPVDIVTIWATFRGWDVTTKEFVE